MGIIVRVPASSANLGPGFDALGLALALSGEVWLGPAAEAPSGEEGPGEHLVCEAARAAYARTGAELPPDLVCRITRNIPAGRGLGASAMARAAGLVGARHLLNDHLDLDTLLDIGARLEGHADNIAAALFGGLQVVVRTEAGALHVRVPLAPGLQVALLVPDFEMPTDASRKALPTQLSRDDAVFNLARSALLVATLATGAFDALAVATQDRLHQPARSLIFPPMNTIIEAALHAGAHGACLSGGGSSVLAFVTGDADVIGAAMVDAARQAGVTAEYIVTAPSDKGAEIVRGVP